LRDRETGTRCHRSRLSRGSLDCERVPGAAQLRPATDETSLALGFAAEAVIRWAGRSKHLFYEDLSPYRYGAVRTGLPGVLNVGWLDSMATRLGDVDDAIVHKLGRFCEAPVLLTRGQHVCGLCGSVTGNGEVWIPGDDGSVYASPAMVAHYVGAHRYAPPAVFLRAVTVASVCLTDDYCRDRVAAHQHKLENAPEPEDILVPYYAVKVFWRRAAFANLLAFEAFMSNAFPMRFQSLALGDQGYFVRTECNNPHELFNDLVNQLRVSGRSPFQCTFKMLYVGETETAYPGAPRP